MTSKLGDKNSAKKVAWISYVMCVLAAVFYCYEYFLRVAPVVMLKDLSSSYNVSAAGLGSLMAYYYFAYVPLQIPVGLMMDKIGPRRIITFACIACAIGTYLFAGTPSIEVAKIGRFMVGFGSAFAYVGVLKLSNLWLPRKYFAMMAGLTTALGMFGAISGEILMAKFVEITGWKNSLYSSGFVGFILAIVLWLVIRDKSDKEVAKQSTESHEGVSIWAELKEVLSTKQLWFNGIIGCLTFLPLTVFAEMWATPFLESLNLSKETAAEGSSLVFLGFGIGGPIWGRLSDYLKSRKRPLLIGSFISGVISLLFLFFTPTNTAILFLLLFLLGLFASAQVIIFAIVNDICRSSLIATAISFSNLLVMLGGMLFQPLVGILLEFIQDSAEGKSLVYSVSDFKIVLLVLPIGLFMATVVCLSLKESYEK